MKARTLCVWFPMWSLTRPDAPSDEALLVVDDRVTGATDDVLDAGVVLGMPRREAEALAPFAQVLIRDVGDETRRFEPLSKSSCHGSRWWHPVFCLCPRPEQSSSTAAKRILPSEWQRSSTLSPVRDEAAKHL